MSLGKFKVVSLRVCLETRTSAKRRGSRGTPSTHPCRSLSLLLCSPCQEHQLCPFQIPVRILYTFFKFLLPCQPLAHKALTTLLRLPARFSFPPLCSHRALSIPFWGQVLPASSALLIDVWSLFYWGVSRLILHSPPSPPTGLCTEQVLNPGLKVLLAESCLQP